MNLHPGNGTIATKLLLFLNQGLGIGSTEIGQTTAVIWSDPTLLIAVLKEFFTLNIFEHAQQVHKRRLRKAHDEVVAVPTAGQSKGSGEMAFIVQRTWRFYIATCVRCLSTYLWPDCCLSGCAHNLLLHWGVSVRNAGIRQPSARPGNVITLVLQLEPRLALCNGNGPRSFRIHEKFYCTGHGYVPFCREGGDWGVS